MWRECVECSRALGRDYCAVARLRRRRTLRNCIVSYENVLIATEIHFVPFRRQPHIAATSTPVCLLCRTTHQRADMWQTHSHSAENKSIHERKALKRYLPMHNIHCRSNAWHVDETMAHCACFQIAEIFARIEVGVDQLRRCCAAY